MLQGRESLLAALPQKRLTWKVTAGPERPSQPFSGLLNPKMAWEKGKRLHNLVPQNQLEAWPVLEIVRQFAIRYSTAGYYDDHCKAWIHEIENVLS